MLFNDGKAYKVPASLSARRAWIEMRISKNITILWPVALRKESVDRNFAWTKEEIVNKSLSARRAWIEIAGQPAHGLPSIGRSPQGERG